MSEILAILQPKQSIHGVLQPATTQQSDYNKLNNKPKINGVELSGDVSLEDLDVAESADTLAGYGITDAYTKTEVDAAINELDGNIDVLIGSVSKFEASMKATRAYTVGDYINVHGKLYKANNAIASGATLSTSTNVDEVTIGDELKANAQSIATAAEQIASNAEEITNVKADFSQLPTDGVTANSKQLLSENGTDNMEPYMFRAVPVNADREEVNAVVGGSVAWNQLVWNGDFSDGVTRWVLYHTTLTVDNGIGTVTNADGSESANVAQAIASVISGHKYYISLDANQSDGKTIAYYLTNCGYKSLVTLTANTWINISAIKNCRGTPTGYANMYIYPPMEQGASVQVKNVEIIDLTTMFGSTIADYIYNLETATPGAGVAWFRKLFPKDYYAFNAGSMLHVECVSAHKTVGFNQWDEVWEVGDISYVTGENVAANDRIRSKNYIPALPNTSYCCNQYTSSGVYVILFYDSANGFIGFYNSLTSTSGVFTTPSNCAYMRFRTYTAYGTTYKNDICINLSDPAKNGTYKPYEKHSYALDPTVTLRGIPKLSDGKLYYDGDRYLPDGTVERRYGIRAYQAGDESLADAITDGVNTVYKLTAPTAETATPYQSLQVCDPNGTEEFVTTGIVPVGHETRYPENLRAKIEGLPWDFSTLIAPTESGIASRNYTVGSLLIMGNVLYKVTANIANGGTITPGTNVTATTLSEVISALQ